MSVVPFRSKGLTGPKGYPLRVVVLECPYDTLLQSDLSRTVFSDVLALKIKGYLKEYPYGVLPLESADYVANHILLCEEIGQKLVPHMGFKSVTYDRCQLHQLEFPIFHMIEAAETPEERRIFREVVHSILENAVSHARKIAYNGSWTISPELRAQGREQVNFRDVSMAIFYQYYRDYGIQQIIAAASTRFKVDKTKTFMGFSHLQKDGKVLSPIFVSTYNREEAYIMHLERFSDELVQMSKTPLHAGLWQDRICIASEREIKKIAA
jgi:hypothetical protein